MSTQLPPDPVMFEQTICSRIAEILLSVDLIRDHVKVEKRDRFPDNEDADIALSTVADPVNSNLRMTSIIQIGIPTVEEKEYTGDTCTQLNFRYPISFDLGVKDEWNTDGASLLYPNSRVFAMAVYMQARHKFKANRTLGFDNCVHAYLQQENVGIIQDEESGGRLHSQDWSLEVQCTSVLV